MNDQCQKCNGTGKRHIAYPNRQRPARLCITCDGTGKSVEAESSRLAIQGKSDREAELDRRARLNPGNLTAAIEEMEQAPQPLDPDAEAMLVVIKAPTQHDGATPHGVGCPGCRELRRCNECGEPFTKDGRPLAKHRCVSGRCYPKCCQRVCTHPVGPGRL